MYDNIYLSTLCRHFVDFQSVFIKNWEVIKMDEHNNAPNNDNNLDELLSTYNCLAPEYKALLVEHCKALLQLQNARKNSEAS